MVTYSIYEMIQSFRRVVEEGEEVDVDALDVHPNQEDGASAWNRYHRDDILFVHVALDMNDSVASLLDHHH